MNKKSKTQAGTQTFVSIYPGFKNQWMSASMLRQTFSLQCCHFSSNRSASCVLSQPIHPSFFSTLVSSLTIPCFLSRVLSSRVMHPCAPTQRPRMTSTLHLTLRNLLTTDFCFSSPLFFCLFFPCIPLLLIPHILLCFHSIYV